MRMLTEENKLHSLNFRIWSYWVLACSCIFAVLVQHLALWPLIGQDEVQIIDLGRSFLNPSTDWSIDWLADESRARLGNAYLGMVVQELAYRLFAPETLGSRLSSLLGALLAATMVLGWLVTRRTPWPAALALALALVVDPILNDSYRQGRVDSWAFACCIAACWLLVVAVERAQRRQVARWPIFIAGLLTGASPFVWITAIALVPLIFIEFARVVRAHWKAAEEPCFSQIRPILLYFVGGALAAATLLLLPFLLNWDVFLSSLESGIRVQKTASAIQRNIFDMYLLYDPMILLAVLGSLFVKRDVSLILGLSMALLMMYQTMIYPMRILYLLPYFLAMIAGACSEIRKTENWTRRKALLIVTIGILLSWNLAVSLVKRPLIAFHQQAARAPGQILEAMDRAIGPGSFRVLLEEWDIYPAARALGWKSYKVFGRWPADELEAQSFLASMDFVVKRNKFNFLVISDEKLEAAGFTLRSTVSFAKAQPGQIELGPFKLRTPDTHYDDVLIYAKPASSPR